MKELFLILALVLACRGGEVYTESWVDAVAGSHLLAARGEHHVWILEAAEAVPRSVGFPQGVAALFPAQGLWVALQNGEFHRLCPQGQAAVWQQEDTLLALGRVAGDQAWVLGRRWLSLMRFHAATGPEIVWQGAAPPHRGPVEFRGAGAGSWLRCGDMLLRLGEEGQETSLSFPAGMRNWAMRLGRVIGLDCNGRLVWLDPASPSHVLEHESDSGQLPSGSWVEIRESPGALWLHDAEETWWCWSERDPAREPTRLPWRLEQGEELVPAGQDLVLVQGSASRKWWRLRGGHWEREVQQARPEALLDRHFRLAAEWRLGCRGELWRLGGAGQESLGCFPGALGLVRAGAGPLLLQEGGLTAFDEGGRIIGGWNHGSCLQAQSLEEHLLVLSETGIESLWIDEDSPLPLHSLPLGDGSRISAGPSWAAVLAEGQMHLINRDDAWRPYLTDAVPAPIGLRHFILLEDRLLLFMRTGLQTWSCRNGIWEPLAPSQPQLVASWACRRGANRLLSLDVAGRLTQVRLVDNLPVEVEWMRELPMTGDMQVYRDTLRITGRTGWMDWPLPLLTVTEPLLSKGPGPRIAFADVRAPAGVLRLQVEGNNLDVAWEGSATRVQVFDLLGRLVRDCPGGNARARLSLAGLPAGCYVVRLKQEGGGPAAQAFSWRP